MTTPGHSGALGQARRNDMTTQRGERRRHPPGSATAARSD
ncbi:hypothetical protein BIWAKO_06216 [Bosea sp. BIWAKO-01]|nr:hypothetical protein BIWAKO_06216 [Bosea sp. BIWAKO-01]